MGDIWVRNTINAGIVLAEYAAGVRFGTDALLLADFARAGCRSGHCVDLGTGSGVIPLLLLGLERSRTGSACAGPPHARNRCRFTGVELQERYAALATRNAAENGFSERFSVVNADLRALKGVLPSGCAETVLSNPPYMRTDCGHRNESPEKYIARHEACCAAADLAAAAARLLKFGGRFYAVYLPERLAVLLPRTSSEKWRKS
mgnify:CR=1 FL=1